MAEGVGLEPSLLRPQALHPKGTLLLPLAWRPQASHLLLPKVSLALKSMFLPASWGDQTRLEEQVPQRSGASVGSGGVHVRGWWRLGRRTVGAPWSGLWPGYRGVRLDPRAELLSALGAGRVGAPLP